MTPEGRVQAAIELLAAITEDQARPADRIASDWFRQRRYAGAKDRAAVHSRVFGILRRRARLDWWIAHANPDGTLANQHRARVIADLCLCDGETRKTLPALFNGGRHAPRPLAGPERILSECLADASLDHPAQPLAVRGECPTFLIDAFVATFGSDALRELQGLAVPAPVDLRVNSLKGDQATARTALHDDDIQTDSAPLAPHGLRARGRPAIMATPAYRNGLVEIQDAGSQVIAALLGAAPGMKICDFCAGAGGKTLALAASMANKGRLVACDVSAGRTHAAAARLRRAGVHNVMRRILTDERDPWLKRQKGSFDRVLVDAPCSGIGSWRRNPDAKWRLDEADLVELVALQARILARAARLVAPGGRLLYATCSLLPMENTQQVDSFLATNPDFHRVPMSTAWVETLGTPMPANFGVDALLTPAQHSCDGFYAAMLERSGK